LPGFLLRSGFISNKGKWLLSGEGAAETSVETEFIKEYGCYSIDVPSYGLAWWHILLIVLVTIICAATAVLSLCKAGRKACKTKKKSKKENASPPNI
jgi:hypothetical protein